MRLLWTCSLSLMCLCALSHGQDLAVSTTDGLALLFEDAGDMRGVAVDGRELPSIESPGGFYVAEMAADPREIVENGSLEADDDGNGIPDGFSASSYWSRDDTVARTGTWSMKCHVPGTEDVNAGSLGIVAPVKGGTTYLISFWLKAGGRGGRYPSSTGYIQQQDETGKRTTEVHQHGMGGGAGGDSDWSRVASMLTTEVDTRKLLVRTDIYYGYGTIWADDFSIKELAAQAAHLPTAARAEGESVLLSGEDEARGLRVEASWEPAGDMLRLSGKITDTSGEDRCLILSYRVPVDAVGGAWGNDIGDNMTIPPTGRSTKVASWGRFGPYSIYPFSSVVLPDASAGLSIGVPMHPAQAFRLAHAGDEGLLVEWDLALTPMTKKFPQSAAFSALLYRHDPKWGFRAAAQKYYDLFPDEFLVRCPKQGNWYYCDVSTLENPEDFGLMFNEKATAESIPADHELGYLNFPYTEPWGWWGWAVGLRPGDDEPQAPKEEVLEYIRDLAAKAPPDADWAERSPELAAQTIVNSGVFDADGDYMTMRRYVAKWGGYNWALNAAPDAVPEGRFSRFHATYLWEIEPKLAMGADGIYLDSVVNSWTSIPNYREEHLARANYPLTFSLLDRRPVQLGIGNHYEFIEHLAKDLHGRGKLLMANIFPYNWVFFNHWLDVMGHEVWRADSVQKMRAQRTLAYHKPYTWLMQLKPEVTAESREQWMRQAMSYGIFPNILGGSQDAERYDRFRPLFKKYMPTIIAMAEAGWEPITHATCDAPGVSVERFGPKEGKLFLSVRNDGEEATEAVVRIDWKVLHLTPQTPAKRMPEGEGLGIDDGSVSVRVEAGDVAVIEFGAVGTR